MIPGQPSAVMATFDGSGGTPPRLNEQEPISRSLRGKGVCDRRHG
ncbi:MAG TPA: hypothetical protein VNO55_16380 [Polyangia bacterium]|nr:hypothetical protein [Polyangia bacterium]